MNQRHLFLIMLLLIPSPACAWEETTYTTLDALIKQADYVVVATVSAPKPDVYSDGIEKRKATFYYSLKGDAPLNTSVEVAIQEMDIPSTFNYQTNFCILFLHRDTRNGFDYIVVGNPHSVLPAGSANDFSHSTDFSRLNGLSSKAAIKQLVKEGIDDQKKTIAALEADVEK